MDGPGLPRTAEGQCGTVLLVAEGTSLRILGVTASLTAAMLHVALGRMFR